MIIAPQTRQGIMKMGRQAEVGDVVRGGDPQAVSGPRRACRRWPVSARPHRDRFGQRREEMA